jgi:hypothetical protein
MNFPHFLQLPGLFFDQGEAASRAADKLIPSASEHGQHDQHGQHGQLPGAWLVISYGDFSTGNQQTSGKYMEI